MANEIPNVSTLSLEEKYRLVDALIASIREEEEREPIPEWHKKILDERLAEIERRGSQGRPWREVLAQLGLKS